MEKDGTVPIIATGKTDIGQKRKTNQDSICILPENLFFAVADGMGGHNGGDIASQTSVKFFAEYFQGTPPVDSKALLTELVKSTNSQIYEKAQNEPTLKGMGTTVAAVLFKTDSLYIANVGDSRVYMVKDKKIYQMSKDHSLVQEKLNLGIYDRVAAAKDKMKNVLVRTVGFESNVDVDVFNYKAARNDIYLICSDGLHAKVSDRHILEIINNNIPDPANCDQATLDKTVDELIQQANDNGGDDNISVILAIPQ